MSGKATARGLRQPSARAAAPAKQPEAAMVIVGTPRKPAAGAAKPNFLKYTPLVLMLGLLAILAYALLFAPGAGEFQYPKEDELQRCTENQTRTCQVGGCVGLQTCFEGEWSGCSWKRICTPGIKTPCLKQGCAYAYQECNPCGTGFGPCLTP